MEPFSPIQAAVTQMKPQVSQGGRVARRVGIAPAGRQPLRPAAPEVSDLGVARARCILELTADHYWEQDEHDRFSLVWHREEGLPEANPNHLLGKTPWELAGKS